MLGSISALTLGNAGRRSRRPDFWTVPDIQLRSYPAASPSLHLQADFSCSKTFEKKNVALLRVPKVL